MSKILITTAIDYVNDVIHIGHAYQKIAADVLARYYRNKFGTNNVFFVTGTDEHGQKVQETAQKNNKTPQEFTDYISLLDEQQQDYLNISYNRFIRTTDKDHIKTVTQFWEKSQKNNDIYLNDFEGLYCIGCESFKTKSELINNHCPLHPNLEIKLIKEKNYFFRWSKYKNFLKDIITTNELTVLPETRKNEVLAFIDKIEDISISRSKSNLQWGINVPNDDSQVIYVWFDALINYLTAGLAINFWDNNTKIIHLLGKDNLRWHALLWPAMLKSAGYRLPNIIYAHGFLTINGQKISKSLGNIIRPSELVQTYNSDTIRYYLMRHTSFENDSDLSLEKIKNIYNGELANGLGNFASRVLALTLNQKLNLQDTNKEIVNKTNDLIYKANNYIEQFKFSEALGLIWEFISFGDNYINLNKPWENKNINILTDLIYMLHNINILIRPFLPDTNLKLNQLLPIKNNIIFVTNKQTLFPKIK
ncbi:MAG: methionine--tRNA ligase [Minisyncoccia bacterium]